MSGGTFHVSITMNFSRTSVSIVLNNLLGCVLNVSIFVHFVERHRNRNKSNRGGQGGEF